MGARSRFIEKIDRFLTILPFHRPRPAGDVGEIGFFPVDAVVPPLAGV